MKLLQFKNGLLRLLNNNIDEIFWFGCYSDGMFHYYLALDQLGKEDEIGDIEIKFFLKDGKDALDAESLLNILDIMDLDRYFEFSIKTDDSIDEVDISDAL